MNKNVMIALVVVVVGGLVWWMMSGGDPMNEHNDNEQACMDAKGVWTACDGDDCAEGAGTCSSPEEAAEDEGEGEGEGENS